MYRSVLKPYNIFLNCNFQGCLIPPPAGIIKYEKGNGKLSSRYVDEADCFPQMMVKSRLLITSILKDKHIVYS